MTSTEILLWVDFADCPHGHEYTEENTLVYHNRRNCRACLKQRNNAR